MKKGAAALFLLIAASSGLFAQFVEDALRFNSPNTIITPRAGALGIAYAGIIDDNAALYYNPAGLTLVRKSEISAGIDLRMGTTETGLEMPGISMDQNRFNFSNFSLVAPLAINDIDTKYTLGIGYYLEKDLDDRYAIENFMSQNTLNNAMARGGSQTDREILQRFGIHDLSTGETPFPDQLHQLAIIREDGGIHNVVAGIGYEISDMMSIGFSLRTFFGTYDYLRIFTEEDANDIYDEYVTEPPYLDLDSFTVTERVIQDASGIGSSVGFLVKVDENMRIGFDMKLPAIVYVAESFSKNAEIRYDPNTQGTPTSDSYGSGVFTNDYSITTPFKFGMGMSAKIADFIVSGSLQFSDASALEFNSTVPEIEEINLEIENMLGVQLDYGIGLEYQPETLPFVARASYQVGTSPYNNNSNTTDVLGLGAGFFISEEIRFDLGYRHVASGEERNLYSGQSFSYERTLSNFSAGVTVRY